MIPSTNATKKALVAEMRTCSIKSSSGTTFAYAKKKKKLNRRPAHVISPKNEKGAKNLKNR